jgi:proteasome assembly chaperone (PAC2) family protein
MSIAYAKDAATSMKAAAVASGVIGTSGLLQVLADLPDIKWWMSLSGIITGLILTWVQVRKVRIQDRQQRIDEQEKIISMKERELHIEQMRRELEDKEKAPKQSEP